MHEGLTLNRWFVWLLYGLFVGVLLAAIALVVSALRRPRTDFGALGRAPWLIVQGGLLLCSAFALLAGAFDLRFDLGPTQLAAVGLYLVVAVVQQIAYLLRVVYPSPNRRRAGISAPVHSDSEELRSDA